MQSLTESEKTGNFKLELIPLDKLEEIIANNKNNNPRNIYFIKEFITVLKCYNDNPNKRMILIINDNTTFKNMSVNLLSTANIPLISNDKYDICLKFGCKGTKKK